MDRNNLFDNIKNRIVKLVDEKNIDIDYLSFKLGLSSREFINNFYREIDDFTFYLQTLSLVEHWEEQ